ncbi:MAG TPA: hypothetical protein PK626_05430 [Bacteroidales bacterium]|nr:hypothetical protein [Bacteroidales bacterium]
MATAKRVSNTDTLKKGIQFFSDGMLYTFCGFDDSQEDIKTKINNVEKFDIMLMFEELDADKKPTGVVVKVCHGTFLKTISTVVNEDGVAKVNRRSQPLYSGSLIDKYKTMWLKCVTYGEWKHGAEQLLKDLIFTCVVTPHTDRIKTYDYENKVWIKSYNESKDGWTSYQLDELIENSTISKPQKN